MSVVQNDHQLVVEVVEDGVGGADTERRSGLLGRADRVKALGGRLRIWTPRGGGTRVWAGAAMRVAAPVPAVVLLSWGHPVDWL